MQRPRMPVGVRQVYCANAAAVDANHRLLAVYLDARAVDVKGCLAGADIDVVARLLRELCAVRYVDERRTAGEVGKTDVSAADRKHRSRSRDVDGILLPAPRTAIAGEETSGIDSTARYVHDGVVVVCPSSANSETTQDIEDAAGDIKPPAQVVGGVVAYMRAIGVIFPAPADIQVVYGQLVPRFHSGRLVRAYRDAKGVLRAWNPIRIPRFGIVQLCPVVTSRPIAPDWVGAERQSANRRAHCNRN